MQYKYYEKFCQIYGIVSSKIVNPQQQIAEYLTPLASPNQQILIKLLVDDFRIGGFSSHSRPIPTLSS